MTRPVRLPDVRSPGRPRASRADVGSLARDRPDVLLTGTVFFDLVFSGLTGPPVAGQEVRSGGLGASPGGIANLAVALRRLGLSVRLDAAFAGDLFGEYLWRTLAEQEQVDLTGSARFPGWTTPLTVSLAYHGDRSMVTHELAQPLPLPAFSGDRPPARALFAALGQSAYLAAGRAAGLRVFADVGWDESERWSSGDLEDLAFVDTFVPNCHEAMAYTRTRSPEAAAACLIDRVPLVVVKCGTDGAIGWQAGEAAPVLEPAIAVEAIDTTGAGDVFDAALIFGSLSEWNLAESLRFANLCAGLSVRHHGGSLSAPSWGEIAAWIRSHPELAARYDFLEPHVRDVRETVSPPRARPTI